MAVLEVKNLSKSFGSLDVLKDISFNVEKGQVVAVIGPAGSGKYRQGSAGKGQTDGHQGSGLHGSEKAQ